MEQQMHPTTVISAYLRCLDDALTILDKELTIAVDVSKREEMVKIVESVVGTKILKKWSTLACNIALDAVGTVVTERNGRKEIDIKRCVATDNGNRLVFVHTDTAAASIATVTGRVMQQFVT